MIEGMLWKNQRFYCSIEQIKFTSLLINILIDNFLISNLLCQFYYHYINVFHQSPIGCIYYPPFRNCIWHHCPPITFQNSKTGDEEENHNYENLDELEADSFYNEWHTAARSNMGGGGNPRALGGGASRHHAAGMADRHEQRQHTPYRHQKPRELLSAEQNRASREGHSRFIALLVVLICAFLICHSKLIPWWLNEID